MINPIQAAIGASGIAAGISSQGRSGVQSNVMTKLDSIESKLSAGGGGLAPVGGGMDPIGGGMDPIADATVNEPYQMPQSRSFI